MALNTTQPASQAPTGNLYMSPGGGTYKDASTYAAGGKVTGGNTKDVNPNPGGGVVTYSDGKGGSSTTPLIDAKPAVIATSNASRTNYANNLNIINAANDNIRAVKEGESASGIAMSLGLTPEKFLELNPGFGAKGGKNDYKGLSGDIKPGQTYTVGPDGTSSPVVEQPKPDKTGNISTPSSLNDGVTTTQNVNTGETTITTSDGVVLDPTIRKMYEDNITQLGQAADEAKSVLDQAKATLQNDPAAQAAADNIKKQYDVLIAQMQEKNKILQGSYAKNSARTGMLQYANEMDTNFKSMEFDRGIQRIADLVDKENTAVSKSNAAYKANDIKALDAATKEYESALKDKQKAILDLNKAINDKVKENAKEIKDARTAVNQQLTNDIKESTALAITMAQTLKDSGVKDPKQIQAYVEAMAETNGITNPDILSSALIKAQGTAESLALNNTRKKQVINKAPTAKTTKKGYENFTNKPSTPTITKVNTYLGSLEGVTDADIKKINANEADFYKVLNTIDNQ